MTTMTLNGTVTTEIIGYNRYTNVEDGKVYSNANVSLAGMDEYDDLIRISQDTVRSISISVDGKTVYNLTNQNGKITRLSEYLNGDRVSMNLDISFTNEDEEETPAEEP